MNGPALSAAPRLDSRPWGCRCLRLCAPVGWDPSDETLHWLRGAEAWETGRRGEPPLSGAPARGWTTQSRLSLEDRVLAPPGVGPRFSPVPHVHSRPWRCSFLRLRAPAARDHGETRH